MDLNGVSSAAQAPPGRSGIELQLLSIIVPTTALQRGRDRKYILHPVGSWEEQLPYTVCSQDGSPSITAPTLWMELLASAVRFELRWFDQRALCFQEVCFIMLLIWSPERQLCWTEARNSNVPREMMLWVIPLHSLTNKAGLQTTMPAEVSACLCVNCSADNGDYTNSDSVFEHNVYRLSFLPSACPGAWA